MAIKVSVGEPKTQEKPFPKLMINKNGAIALMFSPNKGVQLVSKAGNIIHLYDNYMDNTYTDYEGEITLKNE